MAVGRIKVQQQIDGKPFWQTLQKVASTRTLYAGYTMTLVFESSRGLYMVAYSVLKQSLAHHLQTDAEAHSPSMVGSLPLWARTAAGAGANVLCWSIMYPVDVIRSVQMSRSTSDAHAKSGFGGAIDCARGLIREGGVARLYRGFLATPCDTFSHARYKNVGRFGVTRETIEADIHTHGLPLLRKAQEIIAHFKPRRYFIENPDSGQMKRFLAGLPYYRVDYCMYGFQCRKRTRIWTDLEGFRDRLCNKACGSFQNGRHTINAVGGHGPDRKGQGSGSDKRARYKIPASLIHELLSLAIVNAGLQLPEDNGQ